MPPRLYFHSPCFDGVASAVLAWDFLEAREAWAEPALEPVNYDRREGWLASDLGSPAAVVDFLYHPAAAFWADHHETSFLTSEARADYESRRDPHLVYDQGAGSCTGLLWRHLRRAFGHRNARYAELVRWAEKIDAARYDDVEEAIAGDAPALRLNAALGVPGPDGFPETLVRDLRSLSLAETARRPEAAGRSREADARRRRGLLRFERDARLVDGGIVVYDADATDALVPRYAAFRRFPDAAYSLGILRSGSRVSIRANHNPWKRARSVALGKIFEEEGGGGHRPVGAVVLSGDRAREAEEILARVLEEIQRRIRRTRRRAPT